MFILEHQQLHIVKEPMRRNCTHPTYRWKQYAMCDEREPLEAILANMPRPDKWRIVETPAQTERSSK